MLARIFGPIYLGLSVVHCSIGDTSFSYRNCMTLCIQKNCSHETKIMTSSSLDDMFNRMTFWRCENECKYSCTWITVDFFKHHFGLVPQFYGKWPFVRLFGMQEPASVVFSLLNLLSFVCCLKRIREFHALEFTSLRTMWLCYSYLGIFTWLCSAIFHARDTPITERLDYFFAFALIVFGLCSSLIRIIGAHGRFLFVSVFAPALAFCVYHVGYLSFGRFDYGYHLRMSVIIGVTNAISWLAWCLFTVLKSKMQFYVWKCALCILAACCLMTLEILDFPPILWTFDAHSLWHLGTAPLPVLWSSFICDDLEFLERYAKAKRE